MARWWTPAGQADARWPEGRNQDKLEVPEMGGEELGQQWSNTLVVPPNTDVEALNLNLPQDRDWVLAWNERSLDTGQQTQSGCLIRVSEQTPRARRSIGYDVGSGGADAVIVRGAVKVDVITQAGAAVGPQNIVVALWVYPGHVGDRPPIQSIETLVTVPPAVGAWTSSSPNQGWPPKARYNLTILGSDPFDARLLDEQANVVGQRLNIGAHPTIFNPFNIYHPPRCQLQLRNPGTVATVRTISVWRRPD